MTSASEIRLQIESALAQKIPSALTPAPRIIRPLAATGIEPVDEVLQGGLPIGAVSEFFGPECAGRTSLALSFLAQMTQASKVCAWIDVSNVFDPISAAAAGVDLARLLWVRCGVVKQSGQRVGRSFFLPDKYLVPTPAKRGLHGGGFGPHPRGEAKDLSQAVSSLLRPEAIAPRCAEPQRRVPPKPETFEPNHRQSLTNFVRTSGSFKPWSRMEQALRATDLLLQGGGFSAIVLDMGSLAPEFAARVPLATWHRYRAAAERTQSSILLLTQYPCAKSSAELLLQLQPGTSLCKEATIFTGIEHHIEVARRRFTQTPSNVVPLRKPPQNVNAANWQSRAAWAGPR
jgi:recombination protein RecA